MRCMEGVFLQLENVLELSNNIFHEAYHSKVYLKIFHKISSWNRQFPAELLAEFEEMLKIFLVYLTLDSFWKIGFSLGSYFLICF